MSRNALLQGLINEVHLMSGYARQVWRLLPMTRRTFLGMAAFLMALTSAANTAVALLLGRLVDGVQAGVETARLQEAYATALNVLGMLALIYVTRELLHIMRRALVDQVCSRINRDMQLKLVEQVLKSNLTITSHEKIGVLHGKIFRSVDGVVRFVRLLFLDFLPALLVGLFALAAAVFKQPLIGLIMLGTLPVALYLTLRQLRTQKEVRLQLMRDCEQIDGIVVEQLHGSEYIRVANTYRQEMARLGHHADTRRRREIRHHFAMSLHGAAKSLNEALFHLLVLALAVHLALIGRISYGDIVTFSVLFLNVMSPLAEIHRILDEGHEASLRVGELLQLLHEPPDPSFDTRSAGPVILIPKKPVIQVHGLQVLYSAKETQRSVLEGLSFTINHGETIGIAGRSGSGKSTLVRVLLRLLHPQQGTIFYDGVPLHSVSRAEIARLIGYVGQTPFVFSGTIAENIAYGQFKATLDAIRQAARQAHLHDEILAMPGGYDAPVTERGQNLSGGQRQRLALARMFLQQAPILILDEATSALDNISERIVQRALGGKSPVRTTLLIAHRLTTLKHCDRIFVLQDGKLVQSGPYDQLVGQDGVFGELVKSAEQGIL